MCRPAKIKTFIKERCPICVSIIRRFRKFLFEFVNAEYKFTKIYHTKGFGGKFSASGPGSDPEQTSVILQEIPSLIKELNARILLDAACGDFYWMRFVKMDLEKYIGVDIIPEIIRKNQLFYSSETREFKKMNIIKDSLPKADIILCRDCLVHFSFKDIFSTIKYFKRSKSTYLLTTTFPEHRNNIDIITGGWRPLNLQLSPFNFPKPLKLINEKCPERGYSDKCLGLWKLEDIIT